VPRPLRTSFPAAYEVRTVPEMGWAGTGNGALLRLAADNGFEALLTVDCGFAHQQNLDDLPLPVVIMLAASNRPDELRPLVPKAIDVLTGALQRRIYHVSDAAA
ncbi:MAG: hypothetical protein OXH09_04550, partial [Gammaproteobacteria bacterium]|nr:hypothetical protein [Gammaproteobacteria bacterium]